jgi:amino acid permease
VFILVGVLVNVGVNRSHTFIGTKYWHIPGAPFVGGFGGFARVFVTASFACEYTSVACYMTLSPELSCALHAVANEPIFKMAVQKV